MKTILAGVRWPGTAGSLVLGASWLLILAPAGASERKEAADKKTAGSVTVTVNGSPEKTHVLFMGVDFDIEQNKQFYRARDVSGGSFVIKVAGHDVLVPMDRGPVNLKVTQELKLAEGAATVLDLKGERAYTPGNDPQRKIIEAQMAATVAHFTPADDAARLGSDIAIANTFTDADAKRDYIARAETRMNTSMATGAALTGTATSLTGKFQGEMAQELFDAIEVTFRIASSKPLTSAYVVIIAQYRELDEKPGAGHNWIYAMELERIDDQLHRVHILRGGLPPGFLLEKLQLHVYDHGRELATNVADKQVALTREEAFEYLLVDYLGSHKGASIPASPAMGRPAPEARARLVGDQFGQLYYVKVNRDGLAEGAYLDDACSRKVENPLVNSLIKDVRFKPALEKGRPVEGVARLKFSELTL